jgi:hypothetical protein
MLSDQSPSTTTSGYADERLRVPRPTGLGGARQRRGRGHVSTLGPIDAERQSILFYLYSDDLASLRDQLLGAGIEASEIEDGSPGPRQEMRVVDPDGYVLMVAQNDA